jgi:hypothetical protein
LSKGAINRCNLGIRHPQVFGPPSVEREVIYAGHKRDFNAGNSCRSADKAASGPS